MSSCWWPLAWSVSPCLFLSTRKTSRSRTRNPCTRALCSISNTSLLVTRQELTMQTVRWCPSEVYQVSALTAVSPFSPSPISPQMKSFFISWHGNMTIFSLYPFCIQLAISLSIFNYLSFIFPCCVTSSQRPIFRFKNHIPFWRFYFPPPAIRICIFTPPAFSSAFLFPVCIYLTFAT